MRKDLKFVPAPQRFSRSPFCPCGKSNRDGKFCPDKEEPSAGYCHSCGKTFFGDKKEANTIINALPTVILPPSQHSYTLMIETLKDYNNNNFIHFCSALFPDRNVPQLAKTYGIGNSNQGTIFWQMDIERRVRAGKIMKYSASTGKRLQNARSSPNTNWVHRVFNVPNFNLKQCLFGLHLLTQRTKTIAVVESEKTAFMMSIIDKSRIWVATGGKENFKYDVLKDLKGRSVIAYPDNGEYDNWNSKANNLKIYGLEILVSDILENPGFPKGWDLADRLISEMELKKTGAGK